MQTVAVVGGAGFIGSRLMQHLADSGQRGICVDIRAPAPNVEWRSANVLDPTEMLMALGGADAVVHLAGPVLGQARGGPGG